MRNDPTLWLVLILAVAGLLGFSFYLYNSNSPTKNRPEPAATTTQPRR